MTRDNPLVVITSDETGHNVGHISLKIIIKKKQGEIFCFYFCGAETDRRKCRNKVTAEKTTYTVFIIC
jgi:hypothetical protein